MKDFIEKAITGTLSIKVYDAQHNLKDHIETHNMVVNTGFYMLADLLCGHVDNHHYHDKDTPHFDIMHPCAMAIGTLKNTAAADVDSSKGTSLDDAQNPEYELVESDGSSGYVYKGIPAPKGTDRALSYELARVTWRDESDPDRLKIGDLYCTHQNNTNVVVYRGIFQPNVYTCGYVCEAGIFNRDTHDETTEAEQNTMLSRATFRPVYKDVDDTFEITWIIKIGTLSVNTTNTVTQVTTSVIGTDIDTDITINNNNSVQNTSEMVHTEIE